MLSPNPHYYEIRGRAVEMARALGSPVGGAEHLFLGMLHDGGWPVSVISDLVDLGQAEATVLDTLETADLEAKNAPAGGPPEDAVFLPEGQEMDSPLRKAIIDALPRSPRSASTTAETSAHGCT